MRHLVGDVVGELREDVSRSAAFFVGLAHSVAHHGGGHSVGVRIGKVAVSEGRTLVGSLRALVTLSVEDDFHGSMSCIGVSSTTGLHESGNSALLLECVDDF